MGRGNEAARGVPSRFIHAIPQPAIPQQAGGGNLGLGVGSNVGVNGGVSPAGSVPVTGSASIKQQF